MTSSAKGICGNTVNDFPWKVNKTSSYSHLRFYNCDIGYVVLSFLLFILLHDLDTVFTVITVV